MVFNICKSDIFNTPLDLLCFHKERTTVGIKAKAHGHIYAHERDVLIGFGRKLRMKIIYVHEVHGGELAFETLYF